MKISKSLLFLLFSSVLGMNSGCATVDQTKKSSPIAMTEISLLDDHITKKISKNKQFEQGYAVLLIDANYPEGVFDPEKNINGVWNLESELENMAEVLQQVNKNNLSVFEIYIPHHDLDIPTTEPELARYRNDNWIPFPKQFGDAFEQTLLDQELKKRNITHLIVMGRNQGACVKWTVEHALKLGYTVHSSYEVMQGNASYAYQDKDCSVISQNKTEIIPCRDLVSGSGIKPENPDHDYNFLDPKHRKLPKGMEVKPANESADSNFYESQTKLEENYRKLPIF